MADFLQILIAALTVGSLYALIALGYTMVYGILKFINFAHSDVFVLGAWSSFVLATLGISRLGLDPASVPWWFGPIVLVLAMLVCGGVGYCIERFAYRPLRKAPRLNVLITAIGVSLLMQNTGQLQYKVTEDLSLPFGARPVGMPTLITDRALNESTIDRGSLAAGEAGKVKLERAVTILADRSYRLDIESGTPIKRDSLTVLAEANTYPDGQIDVAPVPELSAGPARYELVLLPTVPIRLVDVTIVFSALVLMVGLEILVFRTKLGTAMRAVSFNIETASLMGINVDWVISFTFVTGAMLAGGAGFLNALKYPSLNIPAHEIWVLLGLKAFVAAVVGGIGNIRGAVLGGFLIAFVEFFGKRYINPNLADVYVFSVLIAVLLLKPSGLLGSPVREKV